MNDTRWTVPADLKSGVYAARLRGGGVEDHITFFVRPTTATAKVAMLMPTASYLAYANERFVLGDPGVVEAITGHGLILHDDDYFLGAHPEFGASTYDHHADGAGVCYTSYRRPIMGLRPRHRMAATGVPCRNVRGASCAATASSPGGSSARAIPIAAAVPSSRPT